jgi:hypothetical protein
MLFWIPRTFYHLSLIVFLFLHPQLYGPEINQFADRAQLFACFDLPAEAYSSHRTNKVCHLVSVSMVCALQKKNDERGPLQLEGADLGRLPSHVIQCGLRHERSNLPSQNETKFLKL